MSSKRPTNSQAGKYASINIFAPVVIVLAAMLIPVFIYFRDTSLFIDSLFEREQAQEGYEFYFRDGFDSYAENSEVLDSAPEDLSRWQNEGVITAWAAIEDWRAVERIDLRLTDAAGNSHLLEGVVNIKEPRENNKIKSDDQFADHAFKCEQKLTKWEDFMIVNGENFLFFEYDQPLAVDMSEIVAWQAYDGDTEVAIFDVVIHDGLCETKNSLSGAWASPNGLPQYGVWWTEAGNLIMKNVAQAQYPSNGDHVRILSRQGTPENFIFKTRFKVKAKRDSLRAKGHLPTLLGDETNVNKNTYIRIAWDFDNEFDPGHDQTLIYNSFEYDYLGLQRVYPIERYFVQGFEPHQSDLRAKTKFSFKENRTYEVHAKVYGKRAWVEVYEIKENYFKRVARLEHEFTRERPPQSYPISIETTGNVEMILDDIEVWRLVGGESGSF